MVNFLRKHGNIFAWMALACFWLADFIARVACTHKWASCVSYCEYPQYAKVIMFSFMGLWLLSALLMVISTFVGGVRRHGWVAFVLSIASFCYVFYWPI